MPGFMFSDPSLLAITIRPLVQVGTHPDPAGDPAATQSAIVLISAAVGGAAGAGGIGIVVDCIRATARAATDCEGSKREGAVSAATLVSDGVPGIGVRPWQVQQLDENTSSTSQGRSVAAGLPCGTSPDSSSLRQPATTANATTMHTRIVCALAKPCFRVILVRYRDRARSRHATVVTVGATVLALVLLVFVDAHDAATPLPGALARAAEDALGADVSVSIRTLQGDAPTASLVDVGRAEHATAVARITWLDEQRSQARLDVLPTDGGPARNSTIAFSASDPLAERGRAIGLVLAALVAPENRARLERARLAHADVSPPAVVVSAPPPPAPARHFALDAAAEGGFAVGGAGSGAGGTIGLRWQPGSRVGLRFGAQARFGEISVAEAAATELAAAAGLVLFAIPPADERRFALALRVDALLLYESLSHLSADDAEAVRGAHLLPGADALVEGQIAVSPTLGIVLGAGAEVAFGRTDVIVHLEKVAEIAPFRLVLTGGLVARF